MKARPLFVADSFGKSFGGREVLKAATAWAVPGTITVLFGRNGSGKSTLLKAALGLLHSDFGVLRYDDEAILRPRLHRLARRGLMYLPDRGLLSRRRTLAWHHGLLRRQMKEVPAPGALESVGVEDLLSRAPHEMSGGEVRRAEMSLVLARNPRCLVADEPLAGLAPNDQETISGALRALAGAGCAVLVTGHDVEALMALSDDVVWVVGGTTHWLGPPESARDHFHFRQDYLGPGRKENGP
jgi:ABC-type multidrug transport system ATPase subunit